MVLIAADQYQSNWQRVGRALSETYEEAALPARLKDVIRDAELDPLNRMTGVYLSRFMAGHGGGSGNKGRYLGGLWRCFSWGCW